MLGCDPEVFVTDEAGEVVPVCGLLGGTKTEPLSVPKGMVQEDNALAEFGIDPANSEEEWVDNLTDVLDELKSRLRSRGCNIAILPSYDFKQEVLDSYGEVLLRAGCEPDFNAWTQRKNPRPRLGTLRTAAGHIHIGMEGSMGDKARMVKAHDLFLGVPSVIMDTDTKRRSLYGKAGCFRPKSYGVEYRTLSNFWIESEELMRWAYRNSERAQQFKGEVDSRVRRCIDTHDAGLALELINEYNLEVV